MAGKVVELLPRTKFSWGGLAAGTSLDAFHGSVSNLRDAASAQLLVRVWSNAIGGGTGAGLHLQLVQVCDDAQDPSPLVVGATLVLASVDRFTQAPTLIVRELRWPLGAQARLRVRTTQGTPATANDVEVDASLLVHEAESSRAVPETHREEAACRASSAS